MLALLLPLALAQEPAEPAPDAPPVTDPIFLLDGICSGACAYFTESSQPSLAELRGREIQQRIAPFMTGGTTWDGRGHLLSASGVTADHVAILVDGVLVEGRSARWTRFR